MPENKKILWDDKYKIGVRSIDEQHKQLFNLLNKLYEIDETKSIREVLKNILNEFNDYMKVHFKDEEAYMLSIGYPMLKEHEKMHADIIDTINDIIHTPSNLNIIKTKMRVIAKHALIEHITQEDIKIKLFLFAEGKEDIFELE